MQSCWKARVVLERAVILESESGHETNALHRQSVGHPRRPKALKYGMVRFYGWFHRIMCGRITPTILEKGWKFPRTGPLGLLWMALELSWHLLVCHLAHANLVQWAYNEAQGLLEVDSSALLDLTHSNQFLSYPQWLCHSLKDSALPSCFLLHFH